MSASSKGEIHTLIRMNRLAEARGKCESLCNSAPSDAEAWFLLGTIHGQAGDTDKAVDCLQRSIANQDNVAVTHYNLGLIHLNRNDFAAARACLETALSLEPGFTAARHDLANVIQSAGAAAESIPHYQAALQAEPDTPAILVNLSAAYASTGEPEKAVELLQQAIRLEPSNITAHFSLGNLLGSLADYAGAAQHFRAVLERQPDAVEAMTNLAHALQQSGAFAEAIDSYRKVLEIQGDSADVLFNLGNAQRAAGQLDAAAATYLTTLEQRPGMSMALNNLGLVRHAQGRLEEAAGLYREALVADELQTGAAINLANCYREMRAPERAIGVLQAALEHDPDHPQLHGDLALLLLESGSFSAGWREYEWRRENRELPWREFPFPVWKGETISDKTILVSAEQGIGDEIMFASCYPDLVQVAGHVIIDCEPRLAPLFTRSFPGATVHGALQTDDLSWLTDIPAPDCTVSAGSLPRYFRDSQPDFPDHKGYLAADPVKTGNWRQRYAESGMALAVGISWKGGHVSQAARRSTVLSQWKKILAVPGVCFVNIQYGDVRSELREANDLPGVTIHHWSDSDALRDMDGFAAQIAALDLVISVDNSTVHLAGALGIRTLVLQSYVPDWRWMNHAQDSYWYPAVQQIHQSAAGDWGSALVTACEQLECLV